jgi:hypothetical protein
MGSGGPAGQAPRIATRSSEAIMTFRASSHHARLRALVAVGLLAGGCSEKAATEKVVDRCANVVCAAADACHLAGVCDGNTGTCSSPRKAIVPTVSPLSFTSPQVGVVFAGDLVQFDAPSVTLGCGPAAPGDVSYRWAILAAPVGSRAELTSSTAAAPAFVPDIAGGTYRFSLTVTAATGLDAPPVYLDVAVSACGASAPVIASVAAPQSRPTVGSSVTLTANAYDADQVAGGTCGSSPESTPMEFRWRLLSAPLGSVAAVTPSFGASAGLSFTADLAGTYAFDVTARDAAGHLSEPFPVTVPTGPCGPAIPPIAGAGGPFTVGDAITLSPSGPITDVCVAAPSIASTWSIVARPAGSVASIASPSAGTFVPDLPGTYTVQLVATDQGGHSSAATTSLAVGACSASPVVAIGATYFAPPGGDAGGAQPLVGDRIDLGATVTPGACGAATSGTFTYSWTLLSKPASSSADLLPPGSAAPSFVADVAAGTYQVAVTVTDGLGNQATTFRTFAISPCGSQAPVPVIANGAAAMVNTYGALTLSGSAAVENAGCPARLFVAPGTLAWTLVSAPMGGTALWSGQSGADVAFSPQAPSQGTPYRVALTATGSNGAVGPPAYIDVTASTCGAQAPSVGAVTAAPEPPTVGIPVALAATVSDADTSGACGLADALTWSWTLTAAPAGSAAAILGPTLASPSFVPDLAGSYQVSVTVTDGTGRTAVGVVAVTVAPPLPLSTSGLATVQFVDLAAGGPTPMVSSPFWQGFPIRLSAGVGDGSVACGAGLTCTWAWSLVGVPAGSFATLNAPAVASPSFTPDRAGTYLVRLTTSDGSRTLTTDFPPIMVGLCGGQAPSAAFAASPASAPVGAVVQLDASGSSDSDASPACGLAQPLDYRWEIVALPAGSAAVLNDPVAINPSFTPDRAGDYQLRLTASDGAHAASVTRTVSAFAATALPFAGRFHAATVDGAGRPVFAVYDPSTAGGRVQVWRCTAGCDVPSSATWAQVGGDVDTHVGALTWVDGEEPRPVDVAVDSSGQIVVAYKTLTATDGGIGGCGGAVATFTGGAWSRGDLGIASGFGSFSGCSAAGDAGSDLGRWLSLAVEPSGQISVGASVTFGGVDWIVLATCQYFCGIGMPGSEMVYSSMVSGGVAGIAMGRFIQYLPSDGILTRIAYQYGSEIEYVEIDPNTLTGSSARVPGSSGGRYLRLGRSAGTNVLAWYDSVVREVRMTTCSGSNCASSWRVDGGAADVGRDLAMSLTPSATRLAYWDATNDLLKVAAAATPAGPFTAAPVAGSPSSLSLVTTGGGIPLVAFTVGASPNLWMVRP